MRWGKEIALARPLVRLAVVLALAALTGGCFQPLYGNQSISAGGSVRDKLGAIEIEKIEAPDGTPNARLAVALRNTLLDDLNGGAVPISPTHRLRISLTWSRPTLIIERTSGRPDAQVERIEARYSLIEIATQKEVLTASTFAGASFDIPGSEQRFAELRAWRNAEDRAVELVAQNIRNRLASFFVAGT